MESLSLKTCILYSFVIWTCMLRVSYGNEANNSSSRKFPTEDVHSLQQRNLPGRSNLAFRRPTYQSSTNGNQNQFVASMAVDGNINTFSHTFDGPGRFSWFAVDLQHRYLIQSVVVTNRVDCCNNRMDYFLVGVSDESPTFQTPARGTFSMCGQYPRKAGLGMRMTVHCNSKTAMGRYVIIHQPTDNMGWLTIAEIEVYEYGLANLAFRRPAYQSSTNGNMKQFAASMAVDGDIKTFSHTFDGPGNFSWFAVDLQHRYVVHRVVLTNRLDCCESRMDYFLVGVTDISPVVHTPARGSYSMCGQYSQKAKLCERMSVFCNSKIVPGQFVVIHQPTDDDGWLTIAEIEVYSYGHRDD